MEEMDIRHSAFEVLKLGCQEQNKSSKVNEEEAGGSYLQQSGGDCMLKQESNEAEATELLEKGFLKYGCSHYRRRCWLRSPCCVEIFDCRHCHNEAKNNLNVDPKLRHDIPRHQVSQVICSLCGTEQEVQQVCINCGVCVGKYFCEACKLFDDDTSKRQYHCDGCGICRIGGWENFFHCYKCAIPAWKELCIMTVLYALSFSSSQDMMLLFCHVDIPSIQIA
ncbi:hypothetical protein REPUB_Repub03eG0111900 [Reevesia pubescens]